MMKAGGQLLLILMLFFAACSSGDTLRPTNERRLEMLLTQRDHRIKELEDSLARYTAIYDSDMAAQNAGAPKVGPVKEKKAGMVDPSEPALYKNIVFKHVHPPYNGSTPGLFPEGSERLLFIKDVQYLSEWGLQLMTNEIYARHGMIFSNIKLSNHFNAQPWYHGTSNSVGSRLTTTEIRNLEFLKTYHYTPDPQSVNKNINSNIPPVE